LEPRRLNIFIRSYNDFDHILPIIHFLHNKNFVELKIFGYSERYLSCHEHIEFLKNLGYEIKNFEDEYFGHISKKVLKLRNFINLYNPKLKNKYYRYLIIYLQKSFNIFLEKILSFNIKRFVSQDAPQSITLMDFLTENHFPNKYFIKYSNHYKRPIIAYLHGWYIFTDTEKQVSGTRGKNRVLKLLLRLLFEKKIRVYDKYILGPTQKTFWGLNKIESNRLIEIGIPRFTYEWINCFQKKDKYDKETKCRVAIFLSNKKFGVDLHKLTKLIKIISELKYVTLKIVPHTRQGLSSLNVEANNLQKFLTNDSSYRVVDWSDVCIAYGTSMISEMLIKKKPVIVPDFLHTKETIYTKEEVCYSSKSASDLIDNLTTYKPDTEKVNLFIKNHIYGGYDSYDHLMNKISKEIFS